jgi:hypothetical protein
MRASILLVAFACQPTAGDPKPMQASTPASPVVVELFTSQGCSSCPPADALLAEIVRDGKLGDRPVLALSFHVDYWNRLGWTDPFSSAAWSARQSAYSRSLGERGVYTPQLVVGGRAHVVGSQRREVAAAIASAPDLGELDATIEWIGSHAVVGAGAPAGADAWIAIVEDDLVTDVPDGENAGERLRNQHVVRHLERVAAAGERGTTTIAVDPAWRGRLAAIAFAQRPDDLAIVAARSLPSRR